MSIALSLPNMESNVRRFQSGMVGGGFTRPLVKKEKRMSEKSNHVQIVVAEGKVTLEDLHAALDQAIRHVGGGCNCGLPGSISASSEETQH